MNRILGAFDAAQADFVAARQAGAWDTEKEEAARDALAVAAVFELRLVLDRIRALLPDESSCHCSTETTCCAALSAIREAAKGGT